TMGTLKSSSQMPDSRHAERANTSETSAGDVRPIVHRLAGSPTLVVFCASPRSFQATRRTLSILITIPCAPCARSMSLDNPGNLREDSERPMRGRRKRRHLLIRALATLAIGLSCWQRLCAGQPAQQAEVKQTAKTDAPNSSGAQSFWK